MFSKPPSVSVPILNPLQHVERRQFVTATFFTRRGSGPKGLVVFRQIESSPVSTAQFEIVTFWQPVMSIPSVFGPLTGFLIEIPWMSTLSLLTRLSVQP